MKKLAITTVVALSSLLSGFAVSSELKIPDALTLRSLNGQPVESSLETNVQLKKGKNLLEFTFRDFYSLNPDDPGKWVMSEKLYLIVEDSADTQINLTLPKIDSYEDAVKFSNSPKIMLEKSGKKTEHDLQMASDIFFQIINK